MAKDNYYHDKSYKELLSKKRNFLTFLHQFVKKGWVKKIDNDDLILCDKGFVDPFFDEVESDIIYKVKIADTEIYFYVLLELQSTVDYTMPMRLQYYMDMIRRRVYLDTMKNEREKAGFRIPIVIPIVFYNGSENWTSKMSFSEYQEGSEFFDDEILTDFKYILVNINKITPEELFDNLNAVSAVVLADKVRDSEKELLATIMKVFESKNWDDFPEERDDFEFWVKNALKRIALEEEKIKEILEGLKKGDGNMEKLGIDYIVEKTEARGFIAVALKLLSKGKTIQETTDLLDLSDEQVRQLNEVANAQAV